MNPSRAAAIAVLAATLATVGDGLLLYVANAARPELGLPAIDPVWLSVGGALGVVAIPVYGLGYWAASQLLTHGSTRAARVIWMTGTVGGLLGGVIHALTTTWVRRGLDAAGPQPDPLAALGDSGALLALWAAAAVGVWIASVVFFLAVVRGRTSAPRWTAWTSPALATVFIAIIGLPSELSRSFLVPAAPNLAHVVFFCSCAGALRAPARSMRVGAVKNAV